MPINTFHNLPEEKQDRVMNAAADEFAEHGFHQASVNRMVKALGIAKGSLFKYFGTKEGLFEALFDRALEQVKQSLREAVIHEGHFFERIKAVMLAGLAFIDAHPRLYRIYLKLLFQENAPLRARLITTVRASTAKFLRPMIREGIEAGELRADLDVEATVFILESVLERFLQGARVRGIDETLFGAYEAEAAAQVDPILLTIQSGLAPVHLQRTPHA